MSLSLCKLIDLNTIKDKRGFITFFENGDKFPFDIKRIYYIYGVPDNASRGFHAHKNLQQIFIAIKGSFRIKLDDGKNSKSYYLDSPKNGLYISSMIWREMYNFEKDTTCLVIASSKYDPNDYISDYEEFIHLSKINENSFS